jgi:diacylglycerol kinase
MINHAHRQVKSYRYAAKGVKYTLTTQVNIWIHLLIASVVLILAYFLHFTVNQFLILIITIGFVVMAELYNTAIEEMTNLLSPEYNVQAGVVKDIAAGAVLVSAITAAIVGAWLFIPALSNVF